MENSVLSNDSLAESELDLLRDKLKQKDHIIAEKGEIINSLRQQVNDLNQDLESLENDQQLLTQKVDRLTKDLTTKDEELDAVSHALREVESANEKLSRRMEARTGQIQKFVEDLVAAKKDLEESIALNEQLKHKNEQLTIELEMANSRKRSLQEHEEQLKQQLLLQQEERERHLERQQAVETKPDTYRDLRGTHCRKERQQSRVTQSEINRPELASALHFAMADEIGEIMDSSSAFPPTMFSDTTNYHHNNLLHQQPYARPANVVQVKREPAVAATWSPKVHNEQVEDMIPRQDYHQHKFERIDDLKVRTQVIRQTQSVNNENADVHHCKNHIQKRAHTEEEVFDPMAEYKMRMARASELARRNMQTKPLHQTSYPLELDTFDTTDLTEIEIKRGNMRNTSRPPHRPPPQPPVKAQMASTRQALSNCSNTPPVARRVYKKAEAFIV